MSQGALDSRPGVTRYEPPAGRPLFLSDVIIQLGIAEEDHVTAAVDEARSSGDTVGQILIRHGRITEDQLAHAIAARYGLDHVDLHAFEADAQAANLLPAETAQRHQVVPLAFEPDGSLLIAMADPSDSIALSDISFVTGRDLRLAVAATNQIAEMAERLPLPSPDGEDAVAPPAPVAPPAEVARPAPVASAPTVPVPNFAVAATATNGAALNGHSESPNGGEATALRAELESTRDELESARGELDAVRSELDTANDELSRSRSALEQAHSDAEHSRHERDAIRTELATIHGERDAALAELDAMRADLERVTRDAEMQREAVERAAEAIERAATAERRLAELEDVERRMADAHSIVEKMRSEFEFEREDVAAAQRELRAENARLREKFAAAGRSASDVSRGAQKLAAMLEAGDGEPGHDAGAVRDEDLGAIDGAVPE